MNFGQNDFIQYWAAFRLHSIGADPFDPNLVLAVEKAKGWTEKNPLMMWNPPWLLSMLSPILQLEFETASKVFIGLNVFLIVFSLLLLRQVYDFKKIIYVVFLFPIFLCLSLGQVSIIQAFAVSLMLYATSKNKDILLGLALTLLSVKPQLMYLVLILVIYSLERSRFLKVLSSFIISLGSLITLLFLQSPNTFYYWLERSKHQNSSKLISVYSWKTTTVSTLLRDVIYLCAKQFTIWPMFVFAPLMGIALIFYLFKNKKYSFKELLPLLVPLSCFTTPFGWIYDAATCLVSQSWLYSKPISNKMQILALLLQVLLFAIFIIYKPSYYSYWFFYPVYIFILLKVYNNEHRECHYKE